MLVFNLLNVTSYTANATICLPNVTPNASRWNIGCVGSPHIGAGVGHVHFMLFVSISFALGDNTNVFSVEYGLRNNISINHREICVQGINFFLFSLDLFSTLNELYFIQ